MTEIDRETIEAELEEADKELDSAVEHGRDMMAKYWLGRKKALQDLLNE